MGTVRRAAYGLIVASLLPMGIRAAATSGSAGQGEPKILVEARMVQISDALSQKLGTGGVPAPGKNVTMPLASLLYALGEPNAVRTIAVAKAQARVGETQTITTGAKLKFLLPTPGGSSEPKTTETPVGTTLTIRPLAVRDRDLALHVQFRHARVEQPQKVDPASSLPVGPPLISSQTLINGELHLTPGEPMMAGGLDAPGTHLYTLIRAEVLSD